MKRLWDAHHTDLYQMQNGTWYLRYWSPSLGREIERSLKTKIKIRAIKERKRILEQIGDEKDSKAIKFKRFSDVVRAYRRQRTYDSVATELNETNQIENHILPYFGGFSPDVIDNDLWRRHAKERREKQKGCSLHNERKYLAKILNWAFAKGIIKLKVTLDDFDKNRKSPGVELTQTQFQSIYDYLPADWKDIARIAWEMGCRVGEIKALEWSRVDFETLEIIFEAEDTKNDFARRPVMTKAVKDILERRRGRGVQSPYVFASPHALNKHFSKSDQAWQLAKRKAGVKCRFHDLRHTWLRRSFRASNRYAEICAYAGLSLKKALETYIKFNHTDMKMVSEIYRGTPGKKDTSS